MPPNWLDWARRLDALGQIGLAFTSDPFDTERYQAIRRIAAEIAAHHAGMEPQAVHDLFAADSGYATPKFDVRGVVFRDRQILLVQERSDGRWTLPGGWADVGDSPSEAVVREIREEAGFETRATKLLALLDRDRQGHPAFIHHVYKAFVRCELIGGEPVTSHEIQAVGFFDEQDLPPLSLARTVPAQIARMFEHLHQPDLPADLD